MTFWTPENIRTVTLGTFLARPPQEPESAPPQLTGLGTDTRTLEPGRIFLALRGETHDAHRFIEDAARLITTDDATGMVIIDDPDAIPVPIDALRERFPRLFVLKVADTGRALLKIAGAYRATLARTKVIAVAGSNGKTTATRLIDAALRASLKGTCSAKSFNNAVGVPLTLLSAKPGDQYLICEIGTNAHGEIATLAEVVRPDIAIITSIGREHLEGLGSLDGVAREEASLLGFIKPGGIAIVPHGVSELDAHIKDIKSVKNLVTFGFSSSADVRATKLLHTPHPRSGALGLTFAINDRLTARVPMIGEHNALGSLIAYAVGRRLGVDDTRIVEGLASAQPAPMRLESSTLHLVSPSTGQSTGTVHIINDAYNANPESMAAAVKTLVGVTSSSLRRVAVLADMLEQGDAAPEIHRELARTLIALDENEPRHRVNLAVLVGPLMEHAAGVLRAAGWQDDRLLYAPELTADALAAIAARLLPGDAILLKGSRGMKLERVADAIKPPEAHRGIHPQPAPPRQQPASPTLF